MIYNRISLRTLFLVASVFFTTHISYAQVNQGGEPLFWEMPLERYNTSQAFELPTQDNAQLLKEAEEAEAASIDKPYQFATHVAVDISPANSGQWTEVKNGKRVWELKIKSPEAHSLHFSFDQFFIPKGGELFLYNADKSEYLGSFTEANNSKDSQFNTYPLSGDEIVIQYVGPSEGKNGTGLNLHLSSVYHAFRDINKIAQALGDSGSCNNNVVCSISAGWEDEINAVAMIVVNGANGSGLCTGALINNTANDGHPYFLTANHCTGGNTASWVYRFNWQSTQCTGNTPNGFDTVSGSTILASGSNSDYALFEINNGNPIPASYGVYFAGWDAGAQMPTSSVGIHHPAGDIKKFSIENNASSLTGYGGGPGSGTTHIRVLDWDDGTTEGGSSGSPLFDQNKRIVGQLHGGSAACGNNAPDWYGRFFTSFPNICQWLAPGCNTTVLDGFDPNSPSVALDAQISSVVSPVGALCSGALNPSVILRNAGTDQLTSATITSVVDGVSTVFNWTGNLASGEVEIVNLAAATVGDGSFTFNATVSSPNGGTDENTGNDNGSSQFSVGSNEIDIDIIADRYGAETTWEIRNASNIVVAQGGPYATVGTNGEYPQPTETVCLANGCYDFIIYDSFGDGICCAYGSGSYSVSDSEGNTLTSGGDGWTSSESSNFCLTSPIPGCTNAAACNFNEDANENDGSCAFATLWFADTDNDGFGDPDNSQESCEQPTGFIADNQDCDDTRASVYPGAPGTAEDLDNNCNGQVEGDEVAPQICMGDMNNDGQVDVADLLVLLGAIGCDSDCGQPDMNGDGAVDTTDVVTMLSVFGSVCE